MRENQTFVALSVRNVLFQSNRGSMVRALINVRIKMIARGLTRINQSDKK